MLTGWLDWQRATVAMKCEGVSEADAHCALLPSSPAMTIAGVASSREIVAAHDLDELEAFAPPGLELVSLRWILGHMVEETGRHLGHLDALRELADGVTGY